MKKKKKKKKKKKTVKRRGHVERLRAYRIVSIFSRDIGKEKCRERMKRDSFSFFSRAETRKLLYSLNFDLISVTFSLTSLSSFVLVSLELLRTVSPA